MKDEEPAAEAGNEGNPSGGGPREGARALAVGGAARKELVRIGQLGSSLRLVSNRQLQDLSWMAEATRALTAGWTPAPVLDSARWMTNSLTLPMADFQAAGNSANRMLTAVGEPARQMLAASASVSADVQRFAMQPLQMARFSQVDFGLLTRFDTFVQNIVEIQDRVTAMIRWALEPSWPDLTDADRFLRVLLLDAAKRARADYLLTGDVRAVEEFAFEWLGLKPKPRFRETVLNAVVDVLLAGRWMTATASSEMRTHTDLRKTFRKDVRSAHRGWKPLWENKIDKARVGSLNVSRRLPGGGVTELGLLVPSDVDVEAIALGRAMHGRGPGWQALAELSPDEQQVALLAAAGHTWKDAAVEAGLPEVNGRRIHRKVKRLARKFIARQQQRGRTLSDEGISLR